MKIRREIVPSLDQVEEARENVFFEKLRSTLEAGDFRRQDRMIDRLLEQGYASTDIAAALIHLLQGGATGGTATAAAPATPPAALPPAPKRVEHESPAPRAEVRAPRRSKDDEGAIPRDEDAPSRKAKYERPPRTGREPGFTALFLNVGRKDLVTPADLVGKIAGVTRLPAEIVGAIDIHQRHSLVDVSAEHASLVVDKLSGVRVKGQVLRPALADQTPTV
ncbi:MAG TPA: DbpA RNA binding domain-containing protein [Candidatus Synoicihabitans sp.]|nr:DbpA RNA binding domain-containing protein [Candidatus Synoicihabitans sp.]